MYVERSEALPLVTEQDIVLCRQRVRGLAAELTFGLVDQTKIVTAASEIARNTIIYGGGGAVTCEIVSNLGRRGLRLVFVDTGPGIADLDLALRDGFTSGKGLGLGLGGAKRLVSEFDIASKPGEGTRVMLVRWK